MAIWQAQVVFGGTSNLPTDVYVNTWNFEGGESATDTANIDDMLWDFYSEDYGTLPMIDRMGADLYNGDVNVKIYCMADPEPRVPRATYFHDFNPVSASMLPAEVTMCLSYQGSQVSGEPQARRRGRVFLPPVRATDNANARPADAYVDDTLAGASQLLAAANASVTWQWIVWSRRDDAGIPVVGGWIDNAWDTQRRRGFSTSSRLTWS